MMFLNPYRMVIIFTTNTGRLMYKPVYLMVTYLIYVVLGGHLVLIN